MWHCFSPMEVPGKKDEERSAEDGNSGDGFIRPTDKEQFIFGR